MRSYLSLVPISAHVHRRQSRMTRVCIILAVFLITSLCSIADAWIESEKAAMIDKHGNYHILLQNLPEAEAEEIGGRLDVAAAAWCNELNHEADKDYYMDGRKIVLYGTSEVYIADIRNYSIEGDFPQSDKEILLSEDAKELFAVKAGDSIVLNTPEGDFDYKVSGFCKDDTEFNQIIEGCCVYLNRMAFQNICEQNGENANSRYYLRFTKRAKLQKVITDIREQYGLTDENIDENTAVLGLLGASSNKTAQNVYPLVAICFLLILISGVLMISGCINSNVAQRTHFFGMLRCIGASKRQIMRYVRLEALTWCITAIPIGCLLGVMANWILCAVLRLLVKGEWQYMPLFHISVLGVASGVAMGIITVFIAAHSPAKQAAKVSPILAASGNAGMANVSRGVKPGLFKMETALGFHHAVSAKKNLIFITGSFALTIILFLVFCACFDVVRCLLPSLSNFSPDITIESEETANSIDRELAVRISEIPGVEAAFGTMYAIALPVKVNGHETKIDLMSYEEFMFNNTKKSVTSGDLSKVYGDTDYALTIFSEDGRLEVGDKIQIGGGELEIACVASEGIGSISASPMVVCSEETFTRLMGEQKYLMVNVILKKDAAETDVNEIRSLAGDNPVTDRREEDLEIHSSYWVFRLGAYGFLAIISLITVLNIMNSISMSVSARIKQYGAMRAVGMESRQITKMITAETAAYAICGMIVGDIFGLLLHYLFYARIIITHFGGVWKIPAASLGIISFMVFASCAVAVYAPSKRIRSMAVTETINEL
ncbi:MAG: ABC transporter permease [Bacteroidales bacterium]|nr:ABC transporter permease [Lachnoclostridium sp.]MCM1384014.1 ABC transporter permease [Lachnoclostridium sp.]MCM1466470.1 ABC transporter permease [Bacteroidales bacterium]